MTAEGDSHQPKMKKLRLTGGHHFPRPLDEQTAKSGCNPNRVWSQGSGSSSSHQECYLLQAKPQSYKPEGRVGGRGEGKGGGVRLSLTVQHSFHYTHPVCLHILTLRNFLDIRKETRHHKEVYRKLRMLHQYQKPQFPCWENEGYKWLLHAHLACSKHSWMVGIIVISKI